MGQTFLSWPFYLGLKVGVVSCLKMS